MNFRNRYFQNNGAAWLICAAFLILALLPNSLRAQGEKAVGNKPANLTVSTLPPEEKRWALIVGVNSFGLQGAVNDARALKNALIQYAGFDKKNITLLTSDADQANPAELPTRRNILLALDELSQKVKPDGLFLFAFSGHGKTIENNAYLMPSDFDITARPGLISDLSIDASRLKKEIARMKIRQVLMILDSCRDKIDVDGAKGNAAQALTPDFSQGFSFEKANKDIDAYVTIFGTKEGSYAYEYFDDKTKQWRGFFSRSLENGLSGGAANAKGEVTLGELVRYLQKDVPSRSQDISRVKQEPWKTGDGYRDDDLVLAFVNGIPKQKIDLGIKAEAKINLQNGISILSPRAGEIVDIKTVVSGKTSYADRSHYIAITPVMTGDTWIMRKLEPDEKGFWKGDADFGDSLNGGGEQFLVRVFATADSKIPEGKSTGMPRDAVFSETITVIRRK
jgi:hypothetical protein